MTRRNFTAAVAALLLVLAALTVAIATAELEPCWPDCRHRFEAVRNG